MGGSPLPGAEGVEVVACAKAAPLTTAGRHVAAAIVALWRRNRRRVGDESADDALATSSGAGRLTLDIAVLLPDR
jgi:hypothetical protein